MPIGEIERPGMVVGMEAEARIARDEVGGRRDRSRTLSVLRRGITPPCKDEGR